MYDRTGDLVPSMQACEQMPGLSVLQHGQMVWQRYKELLDHLREGKPLVNEWRLPDWVFDRSVLERQLPAPIVVAYTVYHDCGKPQCLEIGEDGRRHFPNHAAVSKATWLAAGGDAQVGDLIGMDMDFHMLKDTGVPEFAGRGEAATLMLVALAEVHANASLFGGIESTSFKMKWKTLDKRGRAVLRTWQAAIAA